MENPYRQPDLGASPRFFYGRQADIERIYSRIGAERPQSISIIGDLGAGKSAFLRVLEHPQTKRTQLDRPENYRFLLFFLQEEPDLTPEKFMQLVAVGLQEYEDTEVTLTDQGVEQAVMNLTNRGENLIFFLDDFDVITRNTAFPLSFFSFLRSIANTYNVAYITASRQELQRVCAIKDVAESPFFNIFTNVILKPLSQVEVEQFIIEPSSRSGVSLAPEATFLYELAGGGPGFLREACAIAFDLKSEKGELTSNDQDEIRSRMLEELKSDFTYLWEGWGTAVQELCPRILNGEEIGRREAYRLRPLTQHGYLTQDGGVYQFTSKVLENFVAAQCGVQIQEKPSRKKGWLSFLRRGSDS